MGFRWATVRSRVRRWRRHRRHRRRASALTRLVEDRLPAEYTATGHHDAWPLIAAALLSRMTTTLGHIFDLQRRGRAVDAGTLLRSLYEHLVHFAWLAADPSAARIEEWRKDDLESRLTADNDLRQRGEKLYTDAQHEEIKQEIAGLRGNPPLRLVNLAEAADKAWAGKLDEVGHGPSSQMR